MEFTLDSGQKKIIVINMKDPNQELQYSPDYYVQVSKEVLDKAIEATPHEDYDSENKVSMKWLEKAGNVCLQLFNQAPSVYNEQFKLQYKNMEPDIGEKALFQLELQPNASETIIFRPVDYTYQIEKLKPIASQKKAWE